MSRELKNFTDRELLKELIKRNELLSAPNTRRYHAKHKDVLIGIGADHVAEITIDEDALTELLKT